MEEEEFRMVASVLLNTDFFNMTASLTNRGSWCYLPDCAVCPGDTAGSEGSQLLGFMEHESSRKCIY